MGFILDNKNTFEVYLTDIGRRKFFEGGLKDSVAFFSISDSDSNYSIFDPTISQVSEYEVGEVYEIGSIVEYSGNYYRKVSVNPENPTMEYIPTNLTYWDRIYLLDGNSVEQQPIPTINNKPYYKTSLMNGNDEDSSEFIYDVFTQTPLRGKSVDNIDYERALFSVKTNSQRSYVLYEPDLSSSDNYGVLTYIVNE